MEKSRKRNWVTFGICLVVALGVVATVSALTGGRSPQNAGATRSALVGRQVKNFSLGGLNGGEIKAPWESGRASVVVFFASYCEPCQGEMPKIASYIRTHNPRPIDVLAIDAIDERAPAQAMVKRDGVTFPVAFDPNGDVTDGVFGFGEIPESVFISSKGVVEKVYYGAIPQQQLAKGIALLAASS